MLISGPKISHLSGSGYNYRILLTKWKSSEDHVINVSQQLIFFTQDFDVLKYFKTFLIKIYMAVFLDQKLFYTNKKQIIMLLLHHLKSYIATQFAIIYQSASSQFIVKKFLLLISPELIFNKPSMDISLSFISVLKNGKHGFQEKFKELIFLLQ